MANTGTNWLYIDLKGNGIVFQDGGTETMIMEDSGVFRPKENNTGAIGGATHRWKWIFRYLAGQSSTNPGGSNTNTGYYIDNNGSSFFSPGNTVIMYCKQ